MACVQSPTIIDTELPGCPEFQQEDVMILGELVTLYSRNVIECIKTLYGDPEFIDYMVFKPEHHYTSADKTQRIYDELHMGDWWWEVQVSNDAVAHFEFLAYFLLDNT